MGTIEGGAVLEGSIPRHVNPFGETRRVPSGTTIQSVVDNSNAGDVLYIDPAGYPENLVINNPGLTLVGLGARGEPFINPASGGALQIGDLADDTVLINLGLAGASAAAFALNVNAAAECRFHGCKFEGPDGVVVLLDGTPGDQCGNIWFEDCEFAFGGAGVEFDNSAFGFPTQIRFRDCLFHGLTAAAMRNNASGGGVVDFWVKDCEFGNQEDGTEPTKYIQIDRVGDTGLFSGNRFATPTNAAAKMTIAAGVIWAANATEAGWSTARPA